MLCDFDAIVFRVLRSEAVPWDRHDLRQRDECMAADPQDIELTPEQRNLLAAKPEETGRPWKDLLNELFVSLAKVGRANPASGRTLYEALDERGFIGAYDGPEELSTAGQYWQTLAAKLLRLRPMSNTLFF